MTDTTPLDLDARSFCVREVLNARLTSKNGEKITALPNELDIIDASDSMRLHRRLIQFLIKSERPQSKTTHPQVRMKLPSHCSTESNQVEQSPPCCCCVSYLSTLLESLVTSPPRGELVLCFLISVGNGHLGILSCCRHICGFFLCHGDIRVGCTSVVLLKLLDSSALRHSKEAA